MAKIGTLFAELGIDSAKFKAGLDRARRDLNSFEARMQKFQRDMMKTFSGISKAVFSVQGAMLALAGSAVIGGIMKTVGAWGEAEKATAKLRSTLQSTGRYTDEAVSKIQEHATAVQRMTQMGDDALVKVSATVGQFAKSLNIDELADVQKAATGLAEVLEVDLNNAGLLIAKTLGGQTNALARYGIQVDMTKDQHERLNQIMRQTEAMYQQAIDTTDTMEGRQHQLVEVFGDLQETIGQTITRLAGGTAGVEAMRDAIIGLDGWLKKNQETIVNTGRFILQMGESASQAAVIAINSTMAIVNVLSAGILNAVALTLRAMQTMVNNATQSINTVIGLANKIPGLNLSQVGAPGLFGKAAGLVQNQANKMTTAAYRQYLGASSTLGDLLSGKSSFANWGSGSGNLFSGAGNGAGGSEGGGNSKKKKKSGKSDAEKEMDRLKAQAKQLTENMRNIWEKEADAIKEADMLLGKHLISMETYNRAINTAKNDAQQAFKIDGLKEAVKTFTQPMEDFADNFKTDLGDALGDPGFQAVQQVIEDTRTPLEKYNLEVERLNWLHENAGLTSEVFQRGLQAAKEDLENATKTGNDFAQAIGNITSEFGDRFFDTFVSGLKNGKLEFKAFVASALEDLAKLIFKLTVTIPLANALTSALGGKGGGNVVSGIGGLLGKIGGGIIGSFFGGGAGGGVASITRAFADGGVPPVGRWSLVGEKGPELVNFGTTARVYSNRDSAAMLSGGGGGGGVNVTVVQNFSLGVQQAARAEVIAMMPEIEKRTIRAFESAIGRGGSTASAVGRKS